jgi:hypothetical protein
MISLPLATPSLGSQFFVTLRRLLLLFFQNPQESGLRVLNREMTQLLRKMSARVLQATVRSHNQWPVRIQSFYGLGDAVVMQASAESVFENVAPLEGDHSSIIRPRGPADENYKAFVDSLLTPAGHRNFWDIERYTTLIEVWPTPPTKQKVFTQKLTKLITYDNVARIAKSVTFSSRNICERSFVLDYLTHNIDGWVAAPDNAPSQPNEWSEKEKARYHETGRDFTFRFDPECKKQEPYSVEVTVYGGFNEGGRSVDFNLGGEFYCREYCLTLDLTKYLDARWWVEEPKLTIRSFDEKEKEYSSAVTVETARRLEGQWIWEITDIQNKVGVPKNRWNVVVHVSWNLRAPVSLENP